MRLAPTGHWPAPALAALKQRPDGGRVVDEIVRHFDKLYPWPMHFALEYFVAVQPRPPIGAPLLGAKDWWCDNAVIPMLFRDYFAARERLGDAPMLGDAAPPPAAAATIKTLLERVSHPYATSLINHLNALQQTTIDRAFLTSFGRFWKDGKDTQTLVEPEPWREGLTAAEAISLEAPARSLLASGEPRVGKTSFLRLLAKRLEPSGWTVFEASGADLMAGQKWFGELEGRIQQALQELSVTKKVIWYVPDILQIALSGTHQGQAASILDQILPAMTAGRLVIWTEASSASTARLLRLRPALRSVLEVARLEPLTQEETQELARALLKPLSAASGLEIDPACVETALGAARQYLSAGDVSRAGARSDQADGGPCRQGWQQPVDSHGVILTLSQLTGLPASILDNKERVDLSAVRDFFSSRVMGQDEAVGAIVERIAMLKAGLNDPGKPVGVFLFAGPTGTGKTELAKTAAEFLFGSTDRLIRLDMSELQTPEATVKILGSNEAGGDADSLIHRVRKQPFSVVLLDEFEKAHPQVWDLFLQVFDDGRLADQLGHVADFRHCLIILTTNLGATSHRNSGLGFAPAADAYSGDNIMRAIGQTFRPEFQNRLDKVIVFHPAHPRPDARHPRQGAQPSAGTPRPQGPRVGGGVGGLRAGFPAREGLLAGDGRASAQARDRAVRDRAAGGDHRGEALSRGRPVRVHPQRRPGDPGGVRRSRRRHPGRRADFGNAAGAAGHDPGAGGNGRRDAGSRRRARRYRRGAGLGGVGGSETFRCRRKCRLLDSGRGRIDTPHWRGSR